MAMHIFTVRVLDVSNAFHNTNVPIHVPIHEGVYFSPPPYYLDWFEIYYPNFLLNIYKGPFCLQCMNEKKGTKPAGQ